MPVPSYGVAKGRIHKFIEERDDDAPHFQIWLKAGKTDMQIPVNVRSKGDKPELLFLIEEDFRHPVTAALEALEDGFHRLAPKAGSGALDYIRGNLFDRQKLVALPHDLPGDDNDLNDKLTRLATRAQADPSIAVYAVGSRFPERPVKNKPFSFKPDNGVHDIHMNQGNPHPGPFAKDNGVFTDGALLVHFTKQDRWTAVFLAFQSQSFQTDDATGHPRADMAEPGRKPDVLPADPEKLVRIVAALVNPAGAEEGRETVTVINTTPKKISLKGWKLANKQNQTLGLSGAVDANAPLVIRLPAGFQLANEGGTITLLDDRGLKVDGVSYTKDQARDGRTVVF
jgi:uncharacterized protein YukJ